MAAAVLEQGEDAFRKMFRFYRRRNPPADLSGVLAFRAGEPRLRPVELSVGAVSDRDAGRLGLQPLRCWSAYHVDGYPGFLFIVNPFLPGWQHGWVRQCLKLYPRKPNVCNLDLHMSLEGDLWSHSHAQLRKKWSQRRSEKTLLEKLRWVTLGFHYNWDTKKYYREHHSPFPADLAALSRCVSLACGFHGFEAEAGILNYYHMDSSLGIHVDESELDHGSPLLSFSFGQSSIFLLGGVSREVAPTPMMMHSGDIMVMSGASRLLYHAVPRILRHPGGGVLPPCLSVPPSSDDSSPLIEPCSPSDWEACESYLQSARINMTVRRVLAEGGNFPEEGDAQGAEVAHRDSYHNEEDELPEAEEPGLPERTRTAAQD
ncbi:nucleic acid dioxygenase ALKBH1 [Bufo bufo]|uniref:nucleic acid dioxygenase ALKBH1 n=1 Tax=Bufo bufo TaxID=8384 RepID=UPI001ABE5A93|nr:nucleic acid dioxygenase ALKBH1 [Bufo bufo]